MRERFPEQGEAEEDLSGYEKESWYEGFSTRLLRRRIEDARDRRTFQKVFDGQTLDTIQQLAQKGLFDVLEHIVSTGKEAHVFVARDVGDNKRAVKIFKKETTNFKRMNEYIAADERFKGIRHDRRNLVLAWTKKEFKNLLVASRARLPVPLPLGFKQNVLVMEFIGKEGKAAPRLKDTKPSKVELAAYRKQITDFMAGLYLAGLVHADLSEYNTLVHEGRLVVIDFAQALLVTHPNARDFFERDVRNMASYFTKSGLETSYEELYAIVKKNKEEKERSKIAKKPGF